MVTRLRPSSAAVRLLTSLSRKLSGPILRRHSPTACRVLAVGGYGRRELFPYSDIDLLLLVDKEVHGDTQRDALSAFLRSLWDSGLRLSQSVRTVAECCQFDQTNVELSISLIDQRFVIGDHDLYDTLAARLPKFLRANRATLIKHSDQVDQPAPRQVSRHHLSPGAEYQGDSRRHARSACGALARKLRSGDSDVEAKLAGSP